MECCAFLSWTLAQIEKLLEQPPVTRESVRLGKAKRIDSARARYQEFCLSTVAPDTNLSGLKIVIDGSNGAAYKVAPRVLSDTLAWSCDASPAP